MMPKLDGIWDGFADRCISEGEEEENNSQKNVVTDFKGPMQ